jgi:hypothetical protein
MYARLAQSVERETLNLNVVGSTPTLGVIFFPVLFYSYVCHFLVSFVRRIYQMSLLLIHIKSEEKDNTFHISNRWSYTSLIVLPKDTKIRLQITKKNVMTKSQVRIEI